MNINELVEKLQKANWAYRNTDTLLMSDEEYDMNLDTLRKLSPAHPFLSLIGAKPDVGSVILPFTMGSLDKVKNGEGGLARWKKRNNTENVILSGKLDGISALLVCGGNSPRLYLRGDGVTGVDVSRILPSLKLPLGKACVIRGELILPSDKTPPKSIGRSLVNGWVHRALTSAELPKELENVQFLGYQVIEPIMSRGQQIVWLTKNGFRVPPFIALPMVKLDEAVAFEQLQSMRSKSQWPLDGIVIGTDTVPMSVGGGEAKNPSDAVAFKAALDEQRAETTIVGIEWNMSRQSVYIPRIQIEPVQIGGATIQWLSGHNANFVEENKLGPGARIVIIRSGDVIPSLSSVIQPCSEASMPTSPWSWDSNHVHALATNGEAIPPELAAKTLYHAIDTLGVEGIGPGLVTKMVEAGFLTLRSLLDANVTKLGGIIGTGRVTTFVPSLKAAILKATPPILMVASNLLPKGVGERKLRPLFALNPDPSKWNIESLSNVSGWTKDTLHTLFVALPSVIQWCNSIYPEWNKVATPAEPVPVIESNVTRSVAFTGVRPDASLQERMKVAGWVMEDLTKATVLLVTADGSSETGKVVTAKKRGIEICSISDFRARC